MTDLERSLRNHMGDAAFEATYKSAFFRLRDDRPMRDYPLHEVVLKTVESMELMKQGYEPMFIPFGAPGVPTPEPDSKRILEGRSSSSSKRSEYNSENQTKARSAGLAFLVLIIIGLIIALVISLIR